MSLVGKDEPNNADFKNALCNSLQETHFQYCTFVISPQFRYITQEMHTAE